MSSNWSALHAQLVRSVNRHSYTAHFSKLIPKAVAGRSFRDPAQLLEWLHDRRGNPDRRNTVLRHLLALAVAEHAWGELATELMILALWPGLCLIRGKLRRYRTVTPLDADLISCLSIGILRSDLEKVNRVAATLLRNLERDLRRTYLRDAQMLLFSDTPSVPEPVSLDRSYDSPEKIMIKARRHLGEDGLMLALVHVVGFSQKDAARLLGVSHDAARKRCQRAFARLKSNFDA